MQDREEMNLLRKKQEAYIKQVEVDVFSGNHTFLKDIYKFLYICQFGQLLEIFVFYKSIEQLNENIQNQNTEKTKKWIIQRLNNIGYMKEFGDNIRFEFDSDENVKKNYKGNYYFRLL